LIKDFKLTFVDAYHQFAYNKLKFQKILLLTTNFRCDKIIGRRNILPLCRNILTICVNYVFPKH